jgi:hypothetical protein
MLTAKQLRKLTAGSLIAACSIFGTAGLAGAAGDETPPDEGPGPSVPNIPENPSEGLPIPLPGGGG